MIVGADLSLAKTGIALDDAVLKTITPASHLKAYDRLRPMAQAILLYCKGAELVVIEGYDHHPRGALALIRAAELGGIVRAGLNELAVPWFDVPPSVLKKRATGKGNASKVQVFDAAVDAANVAGTTRPATEDEADAFWLRRIGTELVDWPQHGGHSALEALVVKEAPVLARVIAARA